MKTKTLQLRTTFSKDFAWLFLMFIISFVQVQSISAQKTERDGGGGETGGKEYSGVTVKGGMLSFESQEVFNEVYADLEQRILLYNKESDGGLEEPEWEDNAVLYDFEKGFDGYKSLRQAELLREEAFLAEGGDPARFEESDLVVDDIAGAFINTQKQFEIGSSKFLLAHDGMTYEVVGGDKVTMTKLTEGANPYLFDNVKIIGKPPVADCMASFGVNGATEGLDFSFTFTGQPTPVSHPEAAITYHWTFGDGGTSALQNPSHTYGGGGEYEVCVVVEMRTKDGEYCTDRSCKTITVTEEEPQDTSVSCHGAALFVWNETGAPGVLCFTPIGGTIYNITSTAQNPCNTYACDLSPVWVSLTVVLDNGCQVTYSLPVNITSNNCCERNAKSSGTEHYANNYKFTWKQKSSHFLWWFNKITVKMKHYKHNGNRWKKNKKNLRASTYGDVYTEDAAGCGCENDYDVTANEVEPNSKTLTLKKKITKKYKTRKGWEWSAKYYISNSLKLDTKTSVACD